MAVTLRRQLTVLRTVLKTLKPLNIFIKLLFYSYFFTNFGANLVLC